jgi:hypothetical protein
LFITDCTFESAPEGLFLTKLRACSKFPCECLARRLHLGRLKPKEISMPWKDFECSPKNKRTRNTTSSSLLLSALDNNYSLDIEANPQFLSSSLSVSASRKDRQMEETTRRRKAF